jgi:hypothetical protein
VQFLKRRSIFKNNGVVGPFLASVATIFKSGPCPNFQDLWEITEVAGAYATTRFGFYAPGTKLTTCP